MLHVLEVHLESPTIRLSLHLREEWHQTWNITIEKKSSWYQLEMFSIATSSTMSKKSKLIKAIIKHSYCKFELSLILRIPSCNINHVCRNSLEPAMLVAQRFILIIFSPGNGNGLYKWRFGMVDCRPPRACGRMQVQTTEGHFLLLLSSFSLLFLNVF